MIATIRRVYIWHAAHRLPHVPTGHKCRRMHGHTYRVTVTARGEVQATGPEAGMVMDFARLDMIVGTYASLDHTTINDAIDNPTAENIAAWCVERLRPVLAGLVSVAVDEGADGEAEVFA